MASSGVTGSLCQGHRGARSRRLVTGEHVPTSIGVGARRTLREHVKSVQMRVPALLPARPAGPARRATYMLTSVVSVMSWHQEHTLRRRGAPAASAAGRSITARGDPSSSSSTT